MALPQTVMAQPAPAVEPQGVKSADPSDRLAANLVILSQNPRDVTALTEAGLSAIAVGDGDAALAFLARAEDIAPGSAKIKAAIGSALVLKQKPTDALRLFSELQAARHRADYDHDARFDKVTLLAACRDAATARSRLTSASITSREALFTLLTLRRTDFRER